MLCQREGASFVLGRPRGSLADLAGRRELAEERRFTRLKLHRQLAEFSLAISSDLTKHSATVRSRLGARAKKMDCTLIGAMAVLEQGAR